MAMTAFDSYIFDMDGTLWDAVDSYCKVWNVAIARIGAGCPDVRREALETLMGKPLIEIFHRLVGDKAPQERFFKVLFEVDRELMPQLGGTLYPGVRQTLRTLHNRGARLFMVSNCNAGALPVFMRFTGLDGLFTDWLSFGDTGCEKDVNIAALVQRYNLESPVYVGDTAGDLASTHAAGLPFAWAAYGFGRDVRGFDYKLNSISDLLSI